MTFLNPSILFGLFAASIPLLIHLLNLRKIKKVEFSTLAFLKEIQKSKIKKVKLKQWLLLLIRTLIILFLVAAFARPTLESVSLSGISSAAKTSVVFILDNSMSMGYVTENGSYFNQSKKIIREVTGNLHEGDDVSLVTTTSTEPLFTEVESLSRFNKELDVIDISDTKGNISTALLAASKLLKPSKNYNKEIYLFSDFQKNNFSEKNIQKIFSQFNFDKAGNRRIKFYLFDIHKKQTQNVAITKFETTNKIFVKDKTIHFNATITNYSKSSVANNIASLFIDDKRSAQQSFSLDAGQSKQVMFETKLTKTGLVNAVLKLEDDKLNADNSRYVGIFIPDKINVLIYTKDTKNTRYIKAALQNNYSENINVTIKTPEDYSYFATKENAVVVFIGSQGFNLTELKKTKNLPKSLIVFPAENDSKNSFNALIKAIGLPGASSLVNMGDNYLEFDKVDIIHPLFNGLFADKRKGEIESPFIHKYLKVLSDKMINPIVSLIDNSLFLGETNLKKHKILLFTVAPSTAWSNFPIKTIFAPLMERTVRYLSANEERGKFYLAGEPIAINRTNLVIPDIHVMLPNGNDEYISAGKIKGNSIFRYNKTLNAGIYRFYSGNKLIDFATVNIDPRESQNQYSDSKSFAEIFKNSGFNDDIVVVNKYDNLKETITQSRYGTELWRLFLILAFAAAIIEMLVSRSSKKDSVDLTIRQK